MLSGLRCKIALPIGGQGRQVSQNSGNLSFVDCCCKTGIEISPVACANKQAHGPGVKKA